MSDKTQHFKRRLLMLHEVLMSGLMFWAVWNQFRLHDEKEVPWSLERQNQILGRWNGFFTPVGIALHRMAMLEFAKVFDTDPRTASLSVLLKEASKANTLVPNAGPNDLGIVSRRLRQAKSTLATMTKLRNQRLAHADATPEQLPPLMSQQMNNLADDIKFAFNTLSVAHDGNVYSWDSALRTSDRHTAEVLSLLVKEVERAEKRHDDEMVEIVVGHIRGMETTLGRSLDDDEIQSVILQFSLNETQEQRIRQVLRGADDTR